MLSIRKFQQFIEKYKDVFTARDWECLSAHNLLTFDTIKCYPQCSIYWLSTNPNITPEIIKSNPTYDWNYTCYSANPNNTIEFVLENPDKDWCWIRLSRHLRKISQAIEANPDLPWRWDELGCNKHITEKFILKYKNKLGRVWCFETISLAFIQAHSNIDWLGMDERTDVKPEMFDVPNWNMISSCMDMNYILEHPNLPWSVECMSMNPTLTDKHILDNPHLPWEWDYIESTNVSIEMYKKHASSRLYTLPHLPIDYILADGISPYNISNICRNPLNKCSEDIILRIRNRSAKKLYYWWIPICYDITRECGQRMAVKNYEAYLNLV